MDKPLSAGSPIEARCTKCRAVTNHIVIAMVGETPALVQCNTCQGRHHYRPVKAAPTKTTAPATSTAAKRPAARRLSQEQQLHAEWQQLDLASQAGQAKTYQPTAAFAVNSVITHPTFGLGKVTKKVGVNKMEVLFEQGCKILRCG